MTTSTHAVPELPATTDRVLGALARHLPQHSMAGLRLYLRMARVDTGDLPELAVFLEQHDDALTISRSAVPAGYPPLAHVLSVTTGTPVATPRCAACGRATFFLPHLALDGRWCMACVHQRRPGHRRRVCEPCAFCTKVSRVQARWPRGAVGLCCYHKVLQSRTPCGGCGRILPLIGLSPDGMPVCGPCAGSPRDFACRTCGRTGDNHSANACIRCALSARIAAR